MIKFIYNYCYRYTLKIPSYSTKIVPYLTQYAHSTRLHLDNTFPGKSIEMSGANERPPQPQHLFSLIFFG